MSDECGQTHPALDNGSPCVKPEGHYFPGDLIHLTLNGIWWKDETTGVETSGSALSADDV